MNIAAVPPRPAWPGDRLVRVGTGFDAATVTVTVLLVSPLEFFTWTE